MTVFTALKTIFLDRQEIRWMSRKQRLIDDIVNNDLSGNYKFFTNTKDAADWGNTHFKSWADKIIEESFFSTENSFFTKLKAFQFQAGYFYMHVNEALRLKHNSTFIKDLTDEATYIIDEELCQSIIPENISVIRIVPTSFFKEYYLKKNKPEVGLIIKDEAFMSTSLDLTFEGRFDWRNVRNSRSEGLCYMFIKIKRGKNGLYLNKISGRDNEQELLLPRNTSLRIDRILHYRKPNILLLLTLI